MNDRPGVGRGMAEQGGGLPTRGDQRRFLVPFDPEHFGKRAAAGEAVSPEAAFRHAYAANHWSGPESRSGPGSSLDQTAAIRAALPALFRDLGVRTLLDVPCGDWRWMAEVDLRGVRYLGGDLLAEVVERNIARHAGPDREFLVLDLLASPLPRADLVLCRDCLVHLSFADIGRAVKNLRASGSGYLLTTTFPAEPGNIDVHTGDWRPLDLERPPFGWPAPLRVVNEGCTEGHGHFADKSLALWRIEDLPG